MIKMKKIRFPYSLFGIFGLVGLIMCIIGVCILVSGKRFEAAAETVTGTITAIEDYRDADGDRHYQAYVDYSYQGRLYTKVRLNYYSSGMYEGEEIELKIDPQNPRNAKAKNSYLVAGLILSGMGVVFLLVGVVPTIIGMKKSAREKELLRSGKILYATIEQIGINQGYTVNGRHPYVVYCRYTDEFTGVIYRFKSNNIWTNPEPVLQEGSEIRVFVDGRDYSRYYVDVDGCMQNKVIDYT